MIIGLDASNIREGGGVTHLTELLAAAEPNTHGFERVVVWSGAKTLAKIADRDWLIKIHDPLLDRGLVFRTLWQRFRLKRLAEQAGCEVLFVPGGSDSCGFKPQITMSRNLLPFEGAELRRVGWSMSVFRLLLLRLTQSRTFRKADGVIFLTRYARDVVLRATGPLPGQIAAIMHGIDPRFACPPRPQRKREEFDKSAPCRILYVSKVSAYKHQWHVAEAVARLRGAGFHVTLDLIGPPGSGSPRLNATIMRLDPSGSFIRYHGAVPYEELHRYYANAEIGVFASSCEAFGQILTESMSAGLPIACSNRSAMPEILGDAGVYFDPENPADIAGSIRRLIESPELRLNKAALAYERSRQLSWKRCADETFGFISSAAKGL